MEVYIVPQQIVDQYQNSRNGDYSIHFTELNTGEFSINTNAELDAFSYIPWNTFEIRTISNSDFKPVFISLSIQ